MIQTLVCNCFKATKRSFCINMWQWMKHRSTTSLGSQLRGQQQVKAIQSDQIRVTLSGHSLCWVCVCAPVRESLCLLWRETHTKDWRRDLKWDRKWRRKGRFQRRQRVSWQRKMERCSRQQRAEEDSRHEVAAQGKDSQLKKAVRKDSQKWVGIPCVFCCSFAQNTRPR